jgi:hypothetical protein
MEMGDWHLFINQLGGKFVKGLVQGGPTNFVHGMWTFSYGRRGLGDGFLFIFVWRVLGERKRDRHII